MSEKIEPQVPITDIEYSFLNHLIVRLSPGDLMLHLADVYEEAGRDTRATEEEKAFALQIAENLRGSVRAGREANKK